jgi:hypothetical protein
MLAAMRVSFSSEHDSHLDFFRDPPHYFRRSTSGSLAMFAATASLRSLVNRLRRLGSTGSHFEGYGANLKSTSTAVRRSFISCANSHWFVVIREFVTTR